MGTLFNLKAEPVMSFGSARQHHFVVAPRRFVVLAGFGNLSGGMDFWDRNKKKKLGSTNTTRCEIRSNIRATLTVRPPSRPRPPRPASPAVAYGWAPDSRYFVTATLAPRMVWTTACTFTSTTARSDGVAPVSCTIFR